MDARRRRGGALVTDAAELVRGQRGMGLNGHNQPVEGKSSEWFTPPEIIEPLVEALGTMFDLDPASPPGGLPWIPAMMTYDEQDDGLEQEWLGFVWLNPPFGRQVVRWMRRMADHGEGIALVAARVNTKWWHETVADRATSFLMLRKRPYFINSEHERAPFNAGGDIVLVAYGARAHDALVRSGLGKVAVL
jgi:hypothetical protein